MLGWGLLEYTDGYIQSNQYDEALDALKWGTTDWLLKAHETDSKGTTALWVQVGNGDAEYNVWVPPESLGERPAFKVDRQNPGSDVAAEAAATLAAASVVFRPHDAAYADELLDNAKQLYAFADDADLNPSNGKQRGKYSDVVAEAVPSVNTVFSETGELEYYAYYNSWSGYPDELLWGATWMHKAQVAKGIADTTFLDLAEQQYQETLFNAPWTQTWDDKSQGAGILLAQLTQKQSYQNDVEDWLNRWLPPGSDNRPSNGDGVVYTPGGLAWLTNWGSLRASANTAFLAGIYADTVNDPNGEYSQFSQSQVDYMLGDNPQQFSYVIGVGNDYPVQSHHRAASGIIGYGADYRNANLDNAHLLYGALVGGPQSADDNDYLDLRTEFVTNEVSLDYNAGFTGAVARLYEQYGGSPLTDEQLGNLSELAYAPHLQIELKGERGESKVTTYDDGFSGDVSQLNIFLNQSAQLIGNGSQKLELNFSGSGSSSYSVTAQTVLEFEFRSDQAGQLQGIGFEQNNVLSGADNSHFFRLSGSDEFGLTTGTNYVPGRGWQTYSVDVGDWFTGAFQYLTLVHGQTAGDETAQSEFRNIKLFEKPQPTNTSPSTTGLSNVTVLENAADSVINLYSSFADAETSDGDLVYQVSSNTNSSLFSNVSINSAGQLRLDYAAGATGSSSLTVVATDEAGASVASRFDVLVEAESSPTTPTTPTNPVVPTEPTEPTTPNATVLRVEAEEIGSVTGYRLESNSVASLIALLYSLVA